MLTAAWQSMVCSESDQEFHPLLPTIVIFPEIFTPPFLCKAKAAALWLAALPSAGKNSLFVFMSIDNSWNVLVKRTKHDNQDHKTALKTCKPCSSKAVSSREWRTAPEGARPWLPLLLTASTCRRDKQLINSPDISKQWQPGSLLQLQCRTAVCW